MVRELIHRFEHDGARYAVDPDTCFCFECDAISWDVLAYYPLTPTNRILTVLGEKYDRAELGEVVGELEWLRGAKSILRTPKAEDLQTLLEIRRGLRLLTIEMPCAPDAPVPLKRGLFGRTQKQESRPLADVVRDAAALLLSRSETEKELRIAFADRGTLHDPGAAAAACGYALRAARLAGKNLTAVVHVSDAELSQLPAAFAGHSIGLAIEFQDGAAIERYVRLLASARPPSIESFAKTFDAETPNVACRIVLRPGHAAFSAAVERLADAGFRIIEIDLDGAQISSPNLDPAAMLDNYRAVTRYYAGQLLQHRYFRLDPIATMFWHVYQGLPRPRTDPAGTHELAIAADGGIYPSRRLLNVPEFRAGTLHTGEIDAAALKRYDDVGSMTTPSCTVCWARNLCGGGTAAVHHTLTGSFRTPHVPWCDAQRAAIETAVSAFSQLSSKNVPFARVYNVLGRSEKPSLFAVARAAFRMQIGVRPIEEPDAELLTNWEDWNDAAYFLCNETGLLLATKYDREMDSLHPRGIDHELVLVRKDGRPLGLIKVRPDRLPDTAFGWVYLHDPADYSSEGIRRSIRFVLKEAGDLQSIKWLLVPAAEYETPLHEFLRAIGFQRMGLVREALYLHGTYRGVVLYRIGLGAL